MFHFVIGISCGLLYYHFQRIGLPWPNQNINHTTPGIRTSLLTDCPSFLKCIGESDGEPNAPLPPLDPFLYFHAVFREIFKKEIGWRPTPIASADLIIPIFVDN